VIEARISLAGNILPAAGSPAGKYRIIAITEGSGNGWKFSADVLKASLPMWDKARTFLDHSWDNRSVKDLAGVCSDPEWDDKARGIKLTLTPFGPSAGTLTALGDAVLTGGDPAGIGFSADVAFTAEEKEVKEIRKVYSLDLVIDPARGGVFVEKFSQNKERVNMGEETEVKDKLSTQIETDRQAIESLRINQVEREKLAVEAEKAREIRKQMCGHLLESAIAASKLPTAAGNQVRGQFKDKVFELAELNQAIEDTRQLVADLTASAIINGPGRIHAMFTSADKLQAAVDDMLGAERSKGSESLDVARLSGIRELYMMLTGDQDLHGGYYADRVQLATTADFTGLVKNALNKVVVNTWDQLGKAGYDWWQKIVTNEHFSSLQSITGTLVGTVGTLPSISEGAEYTELAIGDSPETASFTKYGGYIPLTLELIDRDETRKLRAYPRELAAAGLRKISALVAAIFTSNTLVGPTMADTGALFNSTAVTTKGGHKNLLTTALSASEWDVVANAVYVQPMLVKQDTGYYGTGPAMAVNPKYLLVPRKLQLTGMKILYPTLENAAQIYSENQQRGQPGDVITVPEWTDEKDWAAVVDPRIVPGIFVGDRFGLMPEIFVANNELSPAVFMNDEHRLKVRHFLAVWVNDFRPLHKSNVT
jgi:hypothetical protein